MVTTSIRAYPLYPAHDDIEVAVWSLCDWLEYVGCVMSEFGPSSPILPQNLLTPLVFDFAAKIDTKGDERYFFIEYTHNPQARKRDTTSVVNSLDIIHVKSHHAATRRLRHQILASSYEPPELHFTFQGDGHWSIKFPSVFSHGVPRNAGGVQFDERPSPTLPDRITPAKFSASEVWEDLGLRYLQIISNAPMRRMRWSKLQEKIVAGGARKSEEKGKKVVRGFLVGDQSDSATGSERSREESEDVGSEDSSALNQLVGELEAGEMGAGVEMSVSGDSSEVGELERAGEFSERNSSADSFDRESINSELQSSPEGGRTVRAGHQ